MQLNLHRFKIQIQRGPICSYNFQACFLFSSTLLNTREPTEEAGLDFFWHLHCVYIVDLWGHLKYKISSNNIAAHLAGPETWFIFLWYYIASNQSPKENVFKCPERIISFGILFTVPLLHASITNDCFHLFNILSEF